MAAVLFRCHSFHVLSDTATRLVCVATTCCCAIIRQYRVIAFDFAQNQPTKLFTMPRWSKADDAKLAQLFRNDEKLPLNLDTKSIQAVYRSHFTDGDRQFATFSPLFKRKARAWQVNKTLEGRREKLKKNKNGKLLLLCCIGRA